MDNRLFTFASFQWHSLGGEWHEQSLSHFPYDEHWLRQAILCHHNHIAVSSLPTGETILHGTLLYQASDETQDRATMHVWIAERKLVTWCTDERLIQELKEEQWRKPLTRCANAPEAFCIIISCILEHFHQGLDGFEVRLGQLEERMRRNNRATLMRSIFERRHDLLHWSHMFIPIEELYLAVEEAFLGRVTERVSYQRLGVKLERIRVLLKHYGAEIDTLIAMDGALSSFRGNDIMKTLTIFTAVFTPAMVIGGIWGMNFSAIPLFSWKWGFVLMSVLIVVSTAASYWWLWRKGWTGDLLNEQGKKFL